MIKEKILINSILPPKASYVSQNEAIKALESPYNLAAAEFLRDTKTTCDIQLIGQGVPPWGKDLVDHYMVTLSNVKHTYTFPFWDSIHNTKLRDEGKGLSLTLNFYSVLAAIGYNVPDNFDDFCAEFGYSFTNEAEYIKVKKTHLDCLEEHKNLTKLFTNEELEKLSDIN